MDLKYEIAHPILFEEFYKKRNRKFVLKSIVRKAYNEILKSMPNNEWIVRYKFYADHIERDNDGTVDTLKYQQYNGILDLPDCYFLHHFGENGLKINKAEFVFGNVKEFPFFISRVIDQSVPSQLIFPKETGSDQQ